MLAIENRPGFNLQSNFRQLLTGQQEGRGTFEPLQQPFSVLIVVAWLVVGAHWFRPPAASLHKIQTGCVPCSDNAAHRGEARGAGRSGFYARSYGSPVLHSKTSAQSRQIVCLKDVKNYFQSDLFHIDS
jgi:hypothetical protein